MHLRVHMSYPNPELETDQVVEISLADRWLVYRRLQELSIPCVCRMNQPLRVTVTNPTTAMQLWSVCQQWNAPRNQLVRFLETCWNLQT